MTGIQLGALSCLSIQSMRQPFVLQIAVVPRALHFLCIFLLKWLALLHMTRVYFNLQLKDRRTAALGAGVADLFIWVPHVLKRKIAMAFVLPIVTMLLIGRKGIRKECIFYTRVPYVFLVFPIDLTLQVPLTTVRLSDSPYFMPRYLLSGQILLHLLHLSILNDSHFDS